MNSARFARFAVDYRPRFGWTVDKELKLLRIHLDSFLTTYKERQNVAASTSDNLQKKSENQAQTAESAVPQSAAEGGGASLLILW